MIQSHGVVYHDVKYFFLTFINVLLVKIYMITKKDILDNELMKLLIEYRINSVWKLLALKGTKNYPEIDDEGATGYYDNKGGLFIPGGFVFEDSDKRTITPSNDGKLSRAGFRKRITKALEFDNATLLYPELVPLIGP